MDSSHVICLNNKLVNIIIFLIIFILSLFGLHQLNSDRISENEDLTENALHAFIISNANGVSNGYFQWDEMLRAVLNNNQAQLNRYENEITSMFSMNDDMEIIEKRFDGSALYDIITRDGTTYIEFGIFDSNADFYSPDQMIRFSIDPQNIFDQTLSNPKSKYHVEIIDSSGIEGIRVINTEKPLQLFHYVSAFSLALLGLFLIQSFRQFSITSHYEIDGLSNIVMLLSKKDSYTAEHSIEVANIAVFIASQLGYSKKEQRTLLKAGHLHDIGKIGISESILNKSGKLLYEEYEEIKKHSLIGYEIVSHFPNLKEVALIVKHHHELLDGSGYPDGLKGSEIPFKSQILNVADVFNALTTDRPYRKGFDKVQAFEIMAQMPLNQELVTILRTHYKK
ncbi:MAG: HD-GYP domain-containing protein [Clostridiales bacterium]|nr:HD-GYP domain-containing protein [Clostridiales bacterium]